MRRFIIDMDEVIADPMGEMIEWYRRTYGLDVDYKKMLVGSWIAGFPEEHQQIVWERLRAPGFFRNLPVMDNSVEILKEMNKRYEVFIVSAAMEFPNSLKEKYDWLMEHFPFFTWKQLTLCGDKKLISGDYMIDDHEKNLIHFTGKPYIFTSPHNLEVKGYERINNWQEAGELFLG
jgi:5'(3')-deoxyribonucleotidase